jgi:glycosyltransferase involved in cell wall biosynthesis
MLKPRLAFFSPLPPKQSGISDYAVWLLRDLKKHYAIDLYHDSGYCPALGDTWYEFGCYDYRVFERRAAIVNYRATLYQMGNSHYHRFVYEILLRHPGLVTLHDFGLADFHTWYASLPGAPADHLRREIEHCCPERAAELLSIVTQQAATREQVVETCMRLGVHLNRRIFERATSVIVHDAWCVRQIEALFPEYLQRSAVIPHGADVQPVTLVQRQDLRARFHWPQDALVFASLGSLHPLKMNTETVRAFASVVRAFPKALLVFVGDDSGGAEARATVKEMGLEERVRFLGRVSINEFVDLAGAVDVGISLRRPPSNGETSGGLLVLLKAGVPTVVMDVGTFAGYPDHTVCKIPSREEPVAALTRAFLRLASDPEQRIQLGRAARDHVLENHAWSRVATLYRDTIEGSRAASIRAARPSTRRAVA